MCAQTRDPAVQIYGVVTDIRTVSREPGGRAIVRGQSYGGRELHNDDIYAAHPDLKEVLQTEFDVWVLGYRHGDTIAHRVPHAPAPIHYDVAVADPAAVRAFGAALGYLRLLYGAQHLPVDELCATLVCHIAAVAPEGPQAYALRACRAATDIIGSDIPRVRHLIGRIRSSLAL